jgi:hypothetical protein
MAPSKTSTYNLLPSFFDTCSLLLPEAPIRSEQETSGNQFEQSLGDGNENENGHEMTISVSNYSHTPVGARPVPGASPNCLCGLYKLFTRSLCVFHCDGNSITKKDIAIFRVWP